MSLIFIVEVLLIANFFILASSFTLKSSTLTRTTRTRNISTNQHVNIHPVKLLKPINNALFSSFTDAQNGRKRREPRNSRVALLWVVESIEKIVAEERKNGKSVNTVEDDKILLKSLQSMLQAKSKKDAMEAEEVLLNLKIENKYSYAIQERVMKAASMAGRLTLSLTLLDSMVGNINGEPYVPSYMAYTSTLNRLRKWRRVDVMRDTMLKLSNACKITGQELHVVALNTYIAALCDAARGTPTRGPTSSFQKKLREANSKGDEMKTELLMEAMELLRPGKSLEKFSVSEPDTMSFNTLLNAAAAMRKQKLVDEVFEAMTAQNLAPDTYTYNAMLKAAPSTQDKIAIIDAILGMPNLSVDKYTIELALLPLAKEGRIEDILKLLKDYDNDGNSDISVANAYSTFLISLVKGREIDVARAIFDLCILNSSLEQGDSTISYVRAAKKDGFDIKVESTFGKRPTPISRHFNALFEGYRTIHATGGKKWSQISKSQLTPQEHCDVLFCHMKAMNVAPDSYSITLLMGLQRKSSEISNLWNSIMEETDIEVSIPIYHSIISAYGLAGDAASACYVFDEMVHVNGFESLNSWNVLLLSLSKASAMASKTVIDCAHAQAASLNFEIDVEKACPSSRGRLGGDRTIIDIVDGLTPPAAAKAILELMNQAKNDENIKDQVLRPNSQSFCLAASALSHADTTQREDAMSMYEIFVDNSLQTDGRMLNAIIRCFGADISGALDVWKTTFRPAAISTGENFPKENEMSVSRFRLTKRGKNLLAAYHGLLHVAGRAYRPDIALRIVYAMKKEKVEPTEASLNCYNAGSRIRDLEPNKIRLHSQYENMLQVECTKYDTADTRRSSEKRVRIII
mmetsp:Transcript_26240/g.40118  ORF Transcript_26240/g.40118 Transcript_26240/m.40118 type:complete len:859 (+) Transcript_26240:205-2781(+)